MEEAQNDSTNESTQNEEMNSIANGNFVSDDDANMDPANNSSHSVNGSDKSTDTDLVRLVFRDDETFDDLHQVIGQCIRDALFKIDKRANLIIEKENNCIKVSEISNENDGSIFMVDTLPMCGDVDEAIPNYLDNSSANVLNHQKTSNENEKNDDSKPKTGNCWNCGGDHNMKDCKEKRDPVAISRAKQQFVSQKPRTERYHLDNEQKYSHFKPGKISDGLRQALGVRSRELPLYIYKMRLHGYPEGWLEEAKINHSGLCLIHSETTSSTGKDIEDGEVDKVTFDPSMFINYPGFNAPVPPHYIDESDYHRVPPMHFSNSIEGLTQMLQNNLTKSYKRKRLKLDVDEKPAIDNLKDDDMDLQESDNENTTTPTVHPQPRPDESNSNAVPDDEASLLELERKKEELRKALEDASSDSSSIPSDQNVAQLDEIIDENQTNQLETDSPQTDTVNEIESAQTAEVIEENLSIETETIVEATEEIVSVKQTDNILDTPKASTTGRSRESVSGTPLMKQVSPFTKLPSGNKWSDGVTDVIDFENLPDSTGTYQKLTGVIKKIRIIQQINDDTEHDSS